MIIDGRAIAREILQEVKNEITRRGRAPRVRAITASPNAATRSYLSIKKAKAVEAGMELEVVELPETASTQDCIDAVLREGADAVIVQLPLPPHIDVQAVVNSIPLNKDADVLSEEAYARFERGEADVAIPPVAGAVLAVLKKEKVDLAGADVVVVGEGKLVGRPVATLLQQKGAKVATFNAENFNQATVALRDAKIIVSGAGKAGLITPEMLGKGQVLIDAGTSDSSGSIAGDFAPECAERAALFTPVPGGIGPIAVACLFLNMIPIAQ